VRNGTLGNWEFRRSAGVITCGFLLCQCWGLNSGPVLAKAGALLLEPRFQPFFLQLFFKQGLRFVPAAGLDCSPPSYTSSFPGSWCDQHVPLCLAIIG
jgi:hypothetical protein